MEEFRKRLKIEYGTMEDIETEKNSGKEAILTRLSNIFEGQVRYVSENNSFTKEEKFEQFSVLINLMKITANYDELMLILDKYDREKTKKEKEKSYKIIEER